MMNKKQRDKVLRNSDNMHFMDTILWCLCAAWLFMMVAGMFTSDTMDAEALAGLVMSPLFMGLLRIRMLVRAIRVDALLREDNGTP